MEPHNHITPAPVAYAQKNTYCWWVPSVWCYDAKISHTHALMTDSGHQPIGLLPPAKPPYLEKLKVFCGIKKQLTKNGYRVRPKHGYMLCFSNHDSVVFALGNTSAYDRYIFKHKQLKSGKYVFHFLHRTRNGTRVRHSDPRQPFIDTSKTANKKLIALLARFLERLGYKHAWRKYSTPWGLIKAAMYPGIATIPAPILESMPRNPRLRMPLTRALFWKDAKFGRKLIFSNLNQNPEKWAFAVNLLLLLPSVSLDTRYHIFQKIINSITIFHYDRMGCYTYNRKNAKSVIREIGVHSFAKDLLASESLGDWSNLFTDTCELLRPELLEHIRPKDRRSLQKLHDRLVRTQRQIANVLHTKRQCANITDEHKAFFGNCGQPQLESFLLNNSIQSDLGLVTYHLPHNASELYSWGKQLGNCLSMYGGLINRNRIIVGVRVNGDLRYAIELVKVNSHITINQFEKKYRDKMSNPEWDTITSPLLNAAGTPLPARYQ